MTTRRLLLFLLKIVIKRVLFGHLGSLGAVALAHKVNGIRRPPVIHPFHFQLLEPIPVRAVHGLLIPILLRILKIGFIVCGQIEGVLLPLFKRNVVIYFLIIILFCRRFLENPLIVHLRHRRLLRLIQWS